MDHRIRPNKSFSKYTRAVSPLRESPVFIDMLTMFSNPIAGILVGIAFTAVLQSASATVGVLQALSVTGVMIISKNPK